ncbi:hypothetical protein BDV25DRAFT_167544 [Aspergillus avenaceus]|uniref:Uncharacterized protein n=1 Tax=Aspergillus avenaceus TaxID=36643 RepID=A0A5N6TDC4_ASPAV|nr:hypothetical protein BDV25DRAFT_167544 [Aspergillus avenaceus]
MESVNVAFWSIRSLNVAEVRIWTEGVALPLSFPYFFFINLFFPSHISSLPRKREKKAFLVRLSPDTDTRHVDHYSVNLSQVATQYMLNGLVCHA